MAAGKTLVGKFTFTVPDTHPQAGEKIEKSFEYQQVSTDDEATQVLTEKKWKLVDLINDNLKANARSNAYQSATIVYRPSEVPAEDIKERMIRDAMRLGMPEDVARQMVDNTLAALGTPKS